MYFDHYLGIDISKATLDAALIIKEGEVVGQTKVANNSHGFNDLASWIRKLKVKLSDVLVCAEHTGIYGYDLQIWLDDMQISFAFVSALEIKRSLGIRRGKNDAVDALRIAEYAYIRRESISLSHKPSDENENSMFACVLRFWQGKMLSTNTNPRNLFTDARKSLINTRNTLRPLISKCAA
mgnify:CR=1 FL=1